MNEIISATPHRQVHTLRALVALVTLVTLTFELPDDFSIVDTRIKYYRSNDTDIDFGGIFRISVYSETMLCSNVVREPRLFQYLEVMKWFLDRFNNGNTSIPNVTLGFCIVDDCSRDQVALARSMQFIRENEEIKPSCQHNTNLDMYNPHNTNPLDGFRDELRHIPVASVLSASNSQGTIPAASLLSVFQMPLISAAATSVELNKKDKYQYFSRTVPSDDKQASVIVDLLIRYDWRYISIVHSSDSYGTMGAQMIKKKLAAASICVAFSHSIQRDREDDGEYEMIAKILDETKNMSTIVLFVGADDARKLMRAFSERRRAGNGTRRHFIFVASDAVNTMDMKRYGSITVNSLFVELYSNYVDDDFYTYFESITAENATNFWMKTSFQQEFNCTYPEHNLKILSPRSSGSCLGRGYAIRDMPNYNRWDGVSLYTEALQVMVDSLRNYILATPDFPKKEDFNSTEVYRQQLYRSLDPKRLMNEINQVIKTTIDEKYKITQLQYDYSTSTPGDNVISVHVGSWCIKNKTLTLRNNTMWVNKTLHVDIDDNNTNTPPISLCSFPCARNEYTQFRMNKCCWDCKGCVYNEYINITAIPLDAKHICVQCPRKLWPDPETKRHCRKIDLTHMDWSAPISIAIGCFCFLGMLLVAYTLAYFWLKRNVKLMKATDIELSMIGLSGVMICYPSAYLHVIPPSDVSCHIAIITLHLGFTITYASLLVKTNRIYRLFNSAKYSSKPPNFIENGYQILITSFFISIQIVILFTTMSIWQPTIKEQLSHPSIKEVELVCGNHLENFLPQIIYNMILLTACSALAFKVRKFPDNFNESKLIFLHTLSTSFLWLAFIPSYLSATNAILKSELLSMLLLIGSTLSTLCLHAPKIYAVQYLNENDMHLTRSFASRSSSSTVAPS